MKKIINKFIFSFIFLIISILIIYKILNPLFISKNVIIPYGIEKFNIVEKEPKLWEILKKGYIIFFIISNFIYSNYIYKEIISKIIKEIEIKKEKNIKSNYLEKNIYEKNNKNNCKNELEKNKEILKLLIGYDEKENKNIYINEKGLYQNFLITGTIGTGKTSSIMYPITKQIIKYNSENKNKKIGMLILDVKGNYFNQVKEYVKKYNLIQDLKVIEIGGKIKYNPLHKPNLKPSILANRLKTILTLFSENNGESYWLDKVETILSEAIKICRLYNNGYVTFKEIHRITTNCGYYKEKIDYLKQLFIQGKLTKKQIYDLNSALDFFNEEYQKLDSRTLSILKSEITRITNVFISDYDVSEIFCAPREKLNFKGFHEVIEKGKIVVLNLNIAEYKNLSKIIAAYLKLDFQTEVMMNLAKGKSKTTAFICDEYSEYVTKTDSDFFSVSREAKCINVVSTQSYSSLKNTLKDDSAVKVICQNLINKIWFRTDDIFTIEEVQKQLGKEDKIKTSKNISENAKDTKYNYITHTMKSKDSNISESLNYYTQNEYIYDTNFFTQELETFNALAFLSDGNKIIKPKKLKMFPYFLER